VAKVSDQNTPDNSDDVILGGSTFELRADDGDGVYEPEGDDAPVLATEFAEYGFAVFHPPAPGAYWITEASAPPGFDIAPPELITYSTPRSSQNCQFYRGATSCVTDDDNSGGFLIAVVTDSPTGGVLPIESGITPPATDSLTPATTTDPRGGWLAVGSVVALAGILVARVRRLR
jgi:hypothetical protein